MERIGFFYLKKSLLRDYVDFVDKETRAGGPLSGEHITSAETRRKISFQGEEFSCHCHI